MVFFLGGDRGLLHGWLSSPIDNSKHLWHKHNSILHKLRIFMFFASGLPDNLMACVKLQQNFNNICLKTLISQQNVFSSFNKID